MLHLADVARLVYQLDGSRHAVSLPRRSDSAAPMTRDRFGRSGQGGAQTLKALHLEALLVRKFCDPWSVFSPSIASFLKRTANVSFVPVDRSFYVGQRIARSSRLQFEMPRADNAPLGPEPYSVSRGVGGHGHEEETAKRSHAKSILRLHDLEVAKTAVISGLSCPDAQRGYRHAIDEFVDRYCSEPFSIPSVETIFEVTVNGKERLRYEGPTGAVNRPFMRRDNARHQTQRSRQRKREAAQKLALGDWSHRLRARCSSFLRRVA